MILLNTAEALAAWTPRLARAPELAIDLESDGLHAYRAGLCVIQVLLPAGDQGPEEVLIVDSLALGDEGIAPLRALFGAEGPTMLVHDIAFDARLLAEHGIQLGRVFDTALAAAFLGEASTGLAPLVAARLGGQLSKKLQHHDWRQRPLEPAHLAYLAGDVLCMPALARSLEADIQLRGIQAELTEETAYRLASALAARPDSRPAYARMRRLSGLDPPALSVLREVAEVREQEARRLDVPPFKVLDNETLIAISRSPPESRQSLSAVRGLGHPRARALHAQLHLAIQRGLAAGHIPEAERAAYFEAPPAPSRAEVQARRGRESRLMDWRRAEAKRRGVDAQAVLPGHCLQSLADLPVGASLQQLSTIAGLGEARLARDAAALLAAVHGPPPADGALSGPPGRTS